MYKVELHDKAADAKKIAPAAFFAIANKKYTELIQKIKKIVNNYKNLINSDKGMLARLLLYIQV